MQIETDPVLRADPLWLALEHAITAVTDEPRILYEKKNEWEGGLNSEQINKLAQDAKLSDHAVYASETLTDGEGDRKWDTERWLKVSHPVFDEPLAIKMWDRVSPHRPTQSQVDRLIAYLKAWQAKRAGQLRSVDPAAGEDVATSTKVSETDVSMSPETRAIALLSEHRDWTNEQIAKEIKVHPKTLSSKNWSMFRNAKKMLKDEGMADIPRGWKNNATGEIDAYDDG